LPVTKFLFWNINRKPLAELVADLAEIHEIDVVLLAECATDSSAVLRALNRKTGTGFHHPKPGLCRRVVVFTRFSREFLQPVFASKRISIRRLTLPARKPVLLVAAHLPSKLRWSGESQASECGVLARQIAAEEQKAGHQRTILVGDLNVNPFEAGVVSAAGLNSVTSRRVASRGTRTVQGRKYKFFYNPMWSHFGDAKSDTAGSYYYDAGEHMNHYWNLFDQVLLRPELAERFDPSRLNIVKSVGSVSLVKEDGRPEGASASDHLPLVFEVKF
jgi:exonuclease III